jgi:hypothetical protein
MLAPPSTTVIEQSCSMILLEKVVHSQFTVLALFQNIAGVSTANNIAPIVEWSSARNEAVWKARSA